MGQQQRQRRAEFWERTLPDASRALEAARSRAPGHAGQFILNWGNTLEKWRDDRLLPDGATSQPEYQQFKSIVREIEQVRPRSVFDE